MAIVIKDLLETIIEKKLTTHKLQAGQYEFHGTVELRVDAQVTKGADVPYTPTVALPHMAILAICLKKAGVQASNIKKMILESVTEALANDEQAHIQTTKKAMGEVEKMLSKLPKKVKTGPTTVDGSVMIIDFREDENTLPVSDVETLQRLQEKAIPK